MTDSVYTTVYLVRVYMLYPDVTSLAGRGICEKKNTIAWSAEINILYLNWYQAQ